MKARYVLLVISLVGFLISYIPGWQRNRETRKQVQELAQILIKHPSTHHLEEGQYTNFLPDLDLWGKQFYTTTNIGRYSRSVMVTSSGSDITLNTDDDISATIKYINVDEMVGDTIERGSRRVGKGLVEGIIDGIRNKKE